MCVCVDSMGFSIHRIMTSVNRCSFISSFPTCLIALARTSSNYSENGHPCLVLDLWNSFLWRESFQSFTVDYDISYGFS